MKLNPVKTAGEADLEQQAAASFEKIVKEQFQESIKLKQKVLETLSGQAAEVALKIAGTLSEGRKILIFGNGGSAADAQHFAGELVGRYKLTNRRALPALALTTDSTVLTCVANDFSFEEVFSRQVEAFAGEGDIVFGISTSGRSPNVLRAFQAAREKGAFTIALLGNDGGPAALQAGISLIVPSADTARIQECHITLIHILCDLIENYPGLNSEKTKS